MFNKILAATDGSDHATQAVAIASDLAARHDADLIIVHVMNDDESLDSLRQFAETELVPETREARRVRTVEATPHGPVPVPGGDQKVVDRPAVRRQIGEWLLRQAEEIAKARGVHRVDCRLMGGDVADQILDSARQAGADAIVLGTRGHGVLKSAFVGSVSHKVCDKAPCTSITVNP